MIMALETLFLLLLAVAGAAVIGFALGRFSAPGERNCQLLQTELDRSRDELDAVRNKVDDHFSESARLFGTLAHDYHALFDHFAQTARQLGLDERETRDLLSPAMRRLPAGETRPETTDNEAAAHEEPPAAATAEATETSREPEPDIAAATAPAAEPASAEAPSPETPRADVAQAPGTPASKEPEAEPKPPAEATTAANDDYRDEREPARGGSSV
jgi:uncharacterized membrane-anchored protein YhcB (DUF1043 family)